MAESPIQTFVFFDVETTGLIHGQIYPKVTELSLIAVSRQAMCDNNRDGKIPRITSRLTIPLNPRKTIPPVASEISGISNELVEHLPPFDDQVFAMLDIMISRMVPPVCFVSHNGNRFDFPILVHELSVIGKTLSNRVLCVDTWIWFHNSLSSAVRDGPSDFKLDTLYSYIIGGEPQDAHYAEGDCVTMLACVMQTIAEFVTWADGAACPIMKFKKKSK